MTKFLKRLSLALLLGIGVTFAQNKEEKMRKTIYDFSAITNNGDELRFDAYRGRVLLIVNTASKCGLTPQYEGLEALHKAYADQGLTVVGFPCNQFAGQEPGSDEEIAKFCKLNYGVSFQMMKKIDVNGQGAHPIYQYLKKAAGGFITDSIKWNFTKFLISRNGQTVKRYAPTTKPESMRADIEELLRNK